MKNLVMMSVLFWFSLALVLAVGAQESKIPSFVDPGRPIEVTVGQDFRIVLDANPTTGFLWKLSAPVDESVVKPLGDEYVDIPPTSVPLTGAGGKHVWKFRAVGRGQTAIRLTYSRPWEKDVPALKDVTYHVNVR